MRYIIHNKHLIEPPHQQQFFEEEVQKKIKTLERVLRGYKKDLLLDVFVRKDSSNRYKIAVSVHLKSKWLLVEGEGYEAVLVVNELLDKLRVRIREQISIERREYLRKRKNRQAEIIQEHIPTLAAYQQQGEKDSFAHLLASNLPSVRNYTSFCIKRCNVFIKELELQSE